jgi:hypothetical protein
MTFPLAIVTPHYALVVNDTRLRFRSTRTNALAYHQDTGAKNLALDGAWLTGGSDSYMAPWMASYLLDGRPIRDEAAFREQLGTLVPHADRAGRTECLWLVQRDADGFAIYCIDVAARTLERAVMCNLDGALPWTDGDPDRLRTCGDLVQACRTEILKPRQVAVLPLPDLLRRLAVLYREVYEICGPEGSVSPELDVGLLLPIEDGGVLQRRLGPLAAERVIAASAEELDRLLVPAEPFVRCNEVAARVLPSAVALTNAQPVWRGGHLFALWIGEAGVQSVKVATSTVSQPAAGTGTAVNGQSGEFDTGAFIYAPRIYLTITPYSGPGATGFQGPPLFTSMRLPYIHGMFDDVTGKPLRTQDFTDGGYAVRAADTAGKEAFDDLYLLSTKTVKVGTVASPASITKTIRIPHPELVPVQDVQAWEFAIEYVRPRVAGTLGMFCSVVLPKGVTITNFRVRHYRNDTGDQATASLNRDLTQIAQNNHNSTGWLTQTASLSQVVGDEAYTVEVFLWAVGTAADARHAWIELDYTMPSYDKGY